MDASGIVRGRQTVRDAGQKVFDQIVAAASGKTTKAVRPGQRDWAVSSKPT